MSEQHRLLREDPGLVLCRRNFSEDRDPHPHALWLIDWITKHEARSVLGVPLADLTRITFDWSVGAVGSPTTPAEVEEAMRAAGAEVGIGRYGEERSVYTSPAFVDPAGGPPRTVHIGVDLFAPPGRAIHAPYDATVHALADNDRPLDYGSVVLLRHAALEGVAFFTLYGHLTRSSLAGLRVGDVVAAGQAFAAIGTLAENGGWAPHVDVQLLVDLFGFGTDIPGVVARDDLGVWLRVSPDPGLILRIPEGTSAL